jgi:hypothetical protein
MSHVEMTCSSNDEHIARYKADNALPTATNIHSLQPLASCGKNYAVRLISGAHVETLYDLELSRVLWQEKLD